MGIEYFSAEARHFPALAMLRYRFRNKNIVRAEDPDFIRAYVAYLKAETELDRKKVFCAAEADTIVGSVNLVLMPKSPKPDSVALKIGYVTNTYVLPEYRNEGIGTRLLHRSFGSCYRLRVLRIERPQSGRVLPQRRKR